MGQPLFLVQTLDRRNRREMKTPVHPSHGVGDNIGIRYIADDDIVDPRHVRALSGRKIIEDPHIVARRNKRIHKVRADKAAAAGNKITRRRKFSSGLAALGCAG